MKTITKYNPNLNCWYEYNPVRAEIVLLTERMRSLVETSDRELLADDEVDYEDLYEHIIDTLTDEVYGKYFNSI